MRITSKFEWFFLLLLMPAILALDNCAVQKQNTTICQQCQPLYKLTQNGTCIISTNTTKTETTNTTKTETTTPLNSTTRIIIQNSSNTTNSAIVNTTLSVITGIQNTTSSTASKNVTILQTSETSSNKNPISSSSPTNASEFFVIVYPNCVQHHHNICIACQQGFILREGLCFLGLKGCNAIGANYIQNTTILQCENCDPHFSLTDGTCKDPHCSIYSEYTGLCYRCQDNFSFNRLYDVCLDLNCLQKSNGECRRCMNEYYLHKDVKYCLKKTLQNCNKYPSNQCNICPQDHFITIDDKKCVPIIQGCQSYSANIGNCLKCFSGLTLNNNKCIDTKCTNNNYPCKKCLAGYSVNQNSICIDPNCIQYQQSKCLSCKNGLLPVEGRCMRPPQFCVRVNAFGECLECSIGFVLQDKQCVVIPIQNCQTRNSTDYRICVQCVAGYYLTADNLCSKINYLCSYFDFTNRICKTCREGSSLQNGVCKDSNCKTSNVNQCLQCANNYIYSITKKVCIYRDPNCLNFDSLSSCSACLQGYVLNADKLCVSIPANCKTFSNGTCSACNQGYYVLSGKCAILPNFCLTANQKGCITCQNRYYVDALGKCMSNPVGCSIAESPSGKCKTCLNNYLLQNGQCVTIPKIQNCKTVNESNPLLCSECNPNYILKEGKCTIKQIPNCLTYNQQTPTICQKCNTGYFGSKCDKVSLRCAPNMYSQVTGFCTGCIQGFILNEKTGACYDPFCRVFTDTTCESCAPNFVLGGKGYCIFSDPNCQILNKDSCNTCKSGYFLQNSGKCYILGENCLKTQNQGVCVQCAANYILKDNKCLKNIFKCQIYNPNTQQCIRCQAFYALVSGSCQAFNCQIYENNRCLKCKTGFTYQSNDDRCIDINCLESTQAGCSKCKSGYFYYNTNNLCYQIIPQNCALYQHELCNTCPTGYFYAQNLGCVKSIAGCTTQNVNLCVQCQYGMQLVNDKCYDKYCLDGNYPCTACKPGYTLTKNNVCLDAHCNQGYVQINGKCYINIPHCESRNPSDLDKCGGCEKNYYVNSQFTCSLLSYLCDRFDQTGSACLLCKNGASLISGKCVDPNCREVANQVCNKCFDGYQLDTNSKLCWKIDPNCMSYRGKVCIECQKDYELKGDICIIKLSKPLPPFCLAGNDEGVCQQCETGYDLVINTCIKRPQFCLAVNLQGQCVSCISTHYIKNQVCVIRPRLPFCSESNTENPEICRVCTTGYSLVQGQCKQQTSIPNCARYVANAIECAECSANFYLSNNQCLAVSSHCAQGKYDPNNGRCLVCASGFELNPATGVCFDPYCTVQSIGACSKCQQNFMLMQNGLCSFFDPNCKQHNTQRCLSCLSGYYLESAFNCFVVPENCQLNSYKNGKCLKCLVGYELKGDICIIKLSKPLPPFCLAGNDEGVCQQCETGYDLVINTCIKRPQFCLAVNLQGQCVSCISTHYIKNQVCVIRPRLPFCNESNTENPEICRVCTTGYSLVQGQCKQQTSIPNCARYAANAIECAECSANFYLSNNQCLAVSSHCAQGKYDPNNGRCLVCASGFELNPATGVCFDPYCTVQSIGACSKCQQNFMLMQNGLCSFFDPTCLQSNLTGCLKCRDGYYLQQNYRCYRTPEFCLTPYNYGQACSSCASAYKLNNNKICIPAFVIQNCLTYDASNTDICLECNDRYYLSGNTCMPVSAPCYIYNKTTGICYQCVNTFQLLPNGTCKAKYTINDPNCRLYYQEACLQCSNRYYVGIQGKCIPVNPFCKTYNVMGHCTSCYPAYRIEGITCIPLNSNDQFCKQVQDKDTCKRCYTGYYPQNGKCVQISPLCKSYDELNGNCLSCYEGYRLNNGKCQVFFKDPYCKTFQNNNCVQCANRYYYGAGKCLPVSNQCNDYNKLTGACLTCYQGYFLSETACIQSQNANKHLNCKIINGDKCSQCYDRYYVKNGQCVEVNEQCKQYNKNNGFCTSCFDGYLLRSDGTCSVFTESQLDPYCKTFQSNSRKVCIQCYPGYFLINGVCKIQSGNCAKKDSNNRCIECYQGYFVATDGNCYISGTQITGVIDPYCLNYQNNKCIKCSDGFYIGSTKCEPVNTQCKTYNQQNGLCTDCYLGWVLQNGTCIDPFSQAMMTVDYCDKFNVKTQECLQCIDYFYLASGRECKPVSVTCGTYDRFTGKCLSCASSSYDLQNGDCYQLLAVIQGCSKYDGPYCVQCGKGYYFDSYYCWRIHEKCIDFDYTLKVCNKCQNGFTALRNNCIPA